MDSTKPIEPEEIVAALQPEFCTGLASPVLDGNHALRRAQFCARRMLSVLRAESRITEVEGATVSFVIHFLQPMLTFSLRDSQQFNRALQILRAGIGDYWGWEEKDGTVHRYTPLEAAAWNDLHHILLLVTALNQVLSQPNPVRAARATALRILGHTLLYLPLAPELLDAVSDADPAIRKVAAESLLPIVEGGGLFCLDERGEATQPIPPALTDKRERIIKALVEAVASAPIPEIHGWLSDILVEFGPEATRALWERARDPHFGTPETRAAALSLLHTLPAYPGAYFPSPEVLC